MGRKINYEWKKQIGPVLYINLFNKRIGLCFCHRKKNRCFKFRGYTFPICSRCCGLYIGIILSIILLWFFPIFNPYFSVLLLYPLMIDFGIQHLLNPEGNNIIRFSTGLLFSFGILMILGVII